MTVQPSASRAGTHADAATRAASVAAAGRRPRMEEVLSSGSAGAGDLPCFPLVTLLWPLYLFSAEKATAGPRRPPPAAQERPTVDGDAPGSQTKPMASEAVVFAYR
jgi:hypothetical protein